jgi:glycine oxidase
VLELLVESGHVTGARTPEGTLEARRVVICAGAWTAKLLEQLGQAPEIAPVRGQMILFYGKPGQINHITLHRERYLIPRRDGRMLFGSTLEHTGFVKTTTAEVKEALYRAAFEMFPYSSARRSKTTGRACDQARRAASPLSGPIRAWMDSSSTQDTSATGW